MKVNGADEAGVEGRVEAQTLGTSSFMGWNLVKFKEGLGLFGNPMVPIQAKDVRQWEHHYAQRSRDETTARAAMARVRDAGVGSRRRGEVQERHEGSRDRRHDRVVASDLPAAAALVERGVNASFLCFECWE